MVAAINGTSGFQVAEFSTWPILYKFKAYGPSGERATVKPDGFIRIHEKEPDGGLSEHMFFLEVDRSTEALDILADRAHRYVDFYRTGGMAERFGEKPENYKEFPFRVLVVCKTAERLKNIALRLLRNTPAITTQVWLSQRTDVMTDPLGLIWTRPIDHGGQNTRDRLEMSPANHVGEPQAVAHRLLLADSIGG
jgi:hypothetical protein